MDSYKNKIVSYYQDCEFQFKTSWHLEDCLTMNFGYWDETTTDLNTALLKKNEILADYVDLKATDKVLDLGCGVGGTLIYLAENKGNSGLGITLVKKQVTKSRQAAKKHKVLDKINFLQADFSKTKLESNSFDVIISMESAGYAIDKTFFLAEVYRLLRPGGRYIIADFFKTTDDLGFEGEKIVSELLNGWAANSYTTSRVYGNLMSKVGLKNIRNKDITNNIIPSSKILYKAFLLGITPAKIGQFIGIRNKIQLGNIWSCYYQYQALKKRYLKYSIIVGEKTS